MANVEVEKLEVKTPQVKKLKSKDTIEKIIKATLRIIATEGVRGVRHRAVAKMAGVALGSTTYYFRDIEDLIASAFEYWRDSAGQEQSPYYGKIDQIISGLAGGDESDKASYVAELFLNSKAYLVDQIFKGQDDRIIELAFYHEALLSNRLRPIVLEYWNTGVEVLTQVHAAFGSEHAHADAEITLAMFQQIERFSVLEENTEVTLARIDTSLKRLFYMCFGVEVF